MASVNALGDASPHSVATRTRRVAAGLSLVFLALLGIHGVAHAQVLPTLLLHLSPSSISENGGSSTVTATLNRTSSAETTLAVSVSGLAVANVVALSDNTTLTIAAGATTSTGTVTITAVNNTVDTPDKSIIVSASVTNSQGVNFPPVGTFTLTIEDDEEAPTATLVLTPDSIDENSGPSMVTATLSHASSATTTISVMAAAGANAADGDFTLSDNTTLTIDPGDTSSTGTVTIAAVNNDVDAPDKEVTVSASAVNTQGVNAPADLTLTIEDDEQAPTAVLHLSLPSIGENGGSSTVTATLSHASSEATTITVAAAAVLPALAADFALSANTTLTIATGTTMSTGTVTIQAVNNDVDAPDKEVTVSASAVNTQGVNAPADLTLTIEDDEDAPTAVLHLSSPSIGENGGSSTVTATLSHASSEATTITVAAAAVLPALAADFALNANTTLTIATGTTMSTGTVTIQAVNNSVDASDKEVTVSASAVNTQGVNAPADLTLTIEDDEQAPTAVLHLSLPSIGENGGSSTVTATLSHASSEATTITVAAAAVLPALAADFALNANTTLTIATGTTMSTGTVTIQAVNNSVDAPDKEVTVSASAVNTQGVNAPADLTLTIEDDEQAPTAVLHLSLPSIGENGGSSTVTATLSHASSEATTITVAAAAVLPALAADFALSANTTLTIAAGDTSSTGTVTIDAVNNDATQPNKEVTVLASAVNTQGVNAPADLTLTLIDDEKNLTATLILTPDSIGEGGSSTVTATLSHVSGAITTLTVSATGGANAADGVFALSANTTLTIAAGDTTSTGTVTITAIDNGVDAPDKSLTVSASAFNSQGVNAPADVTLTLIDDEGEPTVTLILTPDSIEENGGSSTVTAELSHASSQETTLTVSAAAGANAADGDFTLSGTTLTIASGDTSSTGTVTISAVNNDADEPNKEVTVSASASNSQGVNAPADVTLTITDDEDDEDHLLPEVTLAVKALLTRIGRTAASHVVDAVATRLFGTKSGSNVTLAGQRLPFSDAPLPQANAFVGQGPWDARPYNHEWNQISGEQEDLQRTSVRSITSREILAGSSFTLRLAEDDDESKNTGKWTAWGLTAQSDIDGRAGDMLLNGDVTTVIVGLDAELQQTMAGVAVTHSSGDGAFEGSCEAPQCKGTLNTRLTGVYPYLHHDINERVSISGVLGYAKGDLAYSGDNSVAGIESRTAAFSTRGTLQPVPSENGFEFAARLDAFLNWVRTDETANLEAIEANTSRLRLALEASRTLALDSDRTLTSTLQLGLRHDGGDAEIGHGVDINAALRYADPARGLSVEGAIHRLISHEDADYEEQGVSASVRLSPDAAGLGLSLSLASSWSTGATRTNPWSILNAETSSENSNLNAAIRLDAELGYGLPAFGNQSVHTPYFGFSLSDSGETTQRLGWRLRTGSDFTLKLEAARHHQSDGETPQNSFGLQISTPW